ncbi:TadE family type IV pilus minor pilin [Leucobacter denitrificans]|uniref:Pilus assembly protein n=1 Tax=Leucobacter denitrificans TaxID=683042 RepID=A0A7G9S744_9MICO|nr:TadE family type IV pilus minor pilin [Leucobacter denitrificans]QNN63669.1 pilus assembly protein [Leucobacter denitrificans]
MRDLVKEDRGSVTAEFALTVPAVLLILGLVLGSIHLAAERVSLVSFAGELARLEARGDAALAAQRVSQSGSQVSIQRENDGRLLCITATASPQSGLLSALHISGTGCAALSAAVSG